MHKVWRGSHCPVWETILKTPRHNKNVWRSLSTPWQCVVASQDLKYAVFHTYHYLVLQHCSFWDWSNSSTTRTTKLIPKKKQRTLQEMFEGTFAGTKNGTVRFFQVKPAFPVEFPWKMGPPTSSHNELIPTFHPQAIHWYMHPWKLLYTRFAPGSTLYCKWVITYNAMYFVWGITTCNRSCIITTQLQ